MRKCTTILLLTGGAMPPRGAKAGRKAADLWKIIDRSVIPTKPGNPSTQHFRPGT